MVLKSLSRKSGDFLSLLEYINKGEQRKNTAIFHNLLTDPDEVGIIAQEFEDNARYAPQRKNGVMCYHEILSFPAQDSEKLTPEILDEIARKYLWLRAPEALAYAKVHRDTEHPHIHFCISGNKIRQKSKNRLTLKAFRQVKELLRAWVKIRFPELSPSPTPKKSPKKPTHERGQNIKQTLVEKILETLAVARDLSQVVALLSDHGITPYDRGKKAFYGVIYGGKKYRLSTLGVDQALEKQKMQWQEQARRWKQLEAIRETKAQIREQERSYF